jgi:hypothetical protein
MDTNKHGFRNAVVVESLAVSFAPPKRGEGQDEGFVATNNLKLLTPTLSSFGEEREKARAAAASNYPYPSVSIRG